MTLDAYHIDSVNTCMLRLDSSEMLPGSQKGEETAQILSTAIVVRGDFQKRGLEKGVQGIFE